MRQIRVNYVWILLIGSLVALLGIQVFQTRQLYERKSNELNSKFQTILEKIALRHERSENMRHYIQTIDKDFSGQYQDLLKEEFKNLSSVQETVSIRDTSIFRNGKIEDFLVIEGNTYDSITGVKAQQKVLARDVRKLTDIIRSSQFTNEDSLNAMFQLDQKVIEQLFKKSKFVNDLLLEAFQDNEYKKPQNRVQLKYLDSIIKLELKNQELPQKFDFVVENSLGEKIRFVNPTENYNLDLNTSNAHQTELFPGNVLDEDLTLFVSFPKEKSFLYGEMWGYFVASFLLIGLIITALVFFARTILNQKKLSELKNDFINNMTHEFKTPISTISLACQAMNDSDMGSSTNGPSEVYVKMIQDENTRLESLVERILQSATLDRNEINLRKEELLLNEIVHDLVHSSQLRIDAKNGVLNTNICSDLIYIQGDKMHTTNVISNLIDNAIKYSGNNPEVSISLENKGKRVVLTVEDKGIGMKKEHLPKIFDKLYRIPTGNVHNVKGFGLGLSYVKAICDMQGWDIQVKSKFNQGSKFQLTITK